jgi:hypothetical protein
MPLGRTNEHEIARAVCADPERSGVRRSDHNRVVEAWRIKLQRAAEHAATLEAEVAAYLAEEPADVQVEPGDSDFEYLCRLIVRHEPPPSWSAVIGDVLHNVRSALDSITYSILIGRAASAVSDESKRRIGFPITASSEKFNSSRWDQGLADGSTKRMVRAYQPFADIGDLNFGQEDAEQVIQRHPLTQLRDLSNFDKHRSLHPIVVALDMMWLGLPEGAKSEWKAVEGWPWQSGSVIAKINVSGITSPDELEFGHEFAVALAEDAGPLQAAPVTGRLRGFIGHADWVLAGLSRLTDPMWQPPDQG